jgi:hypothetical protein
LHSPSHTLRDQPARSAACADGASLAIRNKPDTC